MNAPVVQPVTRTLTQEMLNAYAEASGDFNPIHTDEAFAKTTPMGGTIAHGMLVLSFISEMMTGVGPRVPLLADPLARGWHLLPTQGYSRASPWPRPRRSGMSRWC